MILPLCTFPPEIVFVPINAFVTVGASIPAVTGLPTLSGPISSSFTSWVSRSSRSVFFASSSTNGSGLSEVSSLSKTSLLASSSRDSIIESIELISNSSAWATGIAITSPSIQDTRPMDSFLVAYIGFLFMFWALLSRRILAF